MRGSERGRRERIAEAPKREARDQSRARTNTTRGSAEQTEPEDGDEARARANNQTDGEGRAQAEKHDGALAPTALPEPVYGRGGLTARERQRRPTGAVPRARRRRPERPEPRARSAATGATGAAGVLEPCREIKRRSRLARSNRKTRDARTKGGLCPTGERAVASERSERGRKRQFCAHNWDANR